MNRMKIISVNLNNRLGNPKARYQITRWLSEHQPSLFLVQEPCPGISDYFIEIDGYVWLGGNTNIAAYRKANFNPSLKILQRNDRWITLNLDTIDIHNLYFPADKANKRKKLFEDVLTILSSDISKKHLLFGDFNMAPREIDGLHGGNVSDWTKKYERQLFNSLLEKLNVVDLFVEKNSKNEYTFERMNAGKLTQFRCDLALVDNQLAINSIIKLDHQVRKGDLRFTDHSAIILEFNH